MRHKLLTFWYGACLFLPFTTSAQAAKETPLNGNEPSEKFLEIRGRELAFLLSLGTAAELRRYISKGYYAQFNVEITTATALASKGAQVGNLDALVERRLEMLLLVEDDEHVTAFELANYLSNVASEGRYINQKRVAEFCSRLIQRKPSSLITVPLSYYIRHVGLRSEISPAIRDSDKHLKRTCEALFPPKPPTTK